MDPSAPAPKAALLHAGNRAEAAAVVRSLGAYLATIYDASRNGRAVVDAALLAAHAGAYRLMVIDGLSTLDRKPLVALKKALVLHELGVEVRSAGKGEGWLHAALPALRDALRWMEVMEHAARTEAVRRGVAAAALAGRLPGRPRRRVDAGALASVGHLSLGEASRLLGIPRTSLRRLLAEQQEAARVQALSTQPQRAA